MRFPFPGVLVYVRFRKRVPLTTLVAPLCGGVYLVAYEKAYAGVLALRMSYRVGKSLREGLSRG